MGEDQTQKPLSVPELQLSSWQSLLFNDDWSFSGLAATGRQTDDCNRRKVSDEKRCHGHLHYYSPRVLERCCKNGRKTVPYVTTEIGGETELFPALGGTAQSHPPSSLSAPSGPSVGLRRDRCFKPAGVGERLANELVTNDPSLRQVMLD